MNPSVCLFLTKGVTLSLLTVKQEFHGKGMGNFKKSLAMFYKGKISESN